MRSSSNLWITSQLERAERSRHFYVADAWEEERRGKIKKVAHRLLVNYTRRKKKGRLTIQGLWCMAQGEKKRKRRGGSSLAGPNRADGGQEKKERPCQRTRSRWERGKERERGKKVFVCLICRGKNQTTTTSAD